MAAIGLVAVALGSATAEDQLPELVIAGTEPMAIADFPPATPQALSPGRYRAEQGGAEFTLEITKDGDGFRVVRTFRAPGPPPQTRDMLVRAHGDVLRDAEGLMVLRLLDDGALLVWEGGDADISPEYWSLYAPE